MVGWCWNKEKRLTEVILTWLELWSVLGRTRVVVLYIDRAVVLYIDRVVVLYIDSCP